MLYDVATLYPPNFNVEIMSCACWDGLPFWRLFLLYCSEIDLRISSMPDHFKVLLRILVRLLFNTGQYMSTLYDKYIYINHARTYMLQLKLQNTRIQT